MDPVTFEVVRNAFYALAREMKTAMMRSASSPIIHSGGDCSAAMFDGSMQLVAQGNDIPTMLGSAVISVAETVKAIGVGNLRPGDVLISNDVYLAGGNHQPDVQFIRPVFHGDRIIAYTMTRGHWVDIGGATPGSFNLVTWDVFSEGVRIPPVRIYKQDVLDRDVVELIIRNTRDPMNRLTDIKAQYAGTFVGERRLLELVKKYGVDTLFEVMRESLDYSERRTRAQIEAMPDGVYVAEDFIEPVETPGTTPKPVKVKVTITIRGSDMLVDFTGSEPQVRGGINCPIAVTYNTTWYTVKALTDPSIPINGGCYRPVKVVAPPGTIVNCTYPASCVAGNTETSPRIVDLLLKALAPAVPQRVIAGSSAAAAAAFIGGTDPVTERCEALRRSYVVFVDVHGGGLGARPARDGINAIRVHIGNTGSQPVEQIEANFPLQIEEWSIVPDSGGPGRWRGGCAAVRRYRSLYEEATFNISGERAQVPAHGLFGGSPGALQRVVVKTTAGGERAVGPKAPQVVLGERDTLSIQPAAGGGYGDPFEREPSRVLEDVLDGYVTVANARERYGVVITGEPPRVDEEATRAGRQARRVS